MTRINCIPVKSLSDQHLLAEYKESTRPFTKVLNRISKGKEVPIITGGYRLGTGHETFFFDKLLWLWYRRFELKHELIIRKVQIDTDKFWSIAEDHKNRLSETKYWNDWTPKPDDMYVNMARLCHRHFKSDLKEFS